MTHAGIIKIAAVIVTAVLILMSAGCTITQTIKANETPAQSPTPIPFEDSINDEIVRAVHGADVAEVVYSNDTRGLSVVLVDETIWSGEAFRNEMVADTFDIMVVAKVHTGRIDIVGISGQTVLIDIKGNEHLGNVYETAIQNDPEVKWENLWTLDQLTANAEYVWWHQAVR